MITPDGRTGSGPDHVATGPRALDRAKQKKLRYFMVLTKMETRREFEQLPEGRCGRRETSRLPGGWLWRLGPRGSGCPHNSLVNNFRGELGLPRDGRPLTIGSGCGNARTVIERKAVMRYNEEGMDQRGEEPPHELSRSAAP